MQKFLNLIIAAAIIYTIIQFKNTEDKVPPISENPSLPSPVTVENSNFSGNFLEKTLSSVLVNILKTEEGKMFFENILQPLNQPLTSSKYSFKINNSDFINSLFKITTFGTGTLGPASCGHIVTINYQIFTTNDNLIEEQTKTYTLGSASILPGIDSVIIGVRVGQTRQAVLPAKYAYYQEQYRKSGIDPNSAYKVNITLKGILPQNFVNPTEVKIFDDEIAYTTPLICGEKVTFDAKITELSNGNILFDSETLSEKLQISIGDLSYPMIFSHALHGKIPAGTRVVIAKGKNFKSLGNSISPIFPKKLPKEDGYFMLELKNFQSN